MNEATVARETEGLRVPIQIAYDSLSPDARRVLEASVATESTQDGSGVGGLNSKQVSVRLPELGADRLNVAVQELAAKNLIRPLSAVASVAGLHFSQVTPRGLALAILDSSVLPNAQAAMDVLLSRGTTRSGDTFLGGQQLLSEARLVPRDLNRAAAFLADTGLIRTSGEGQPLTFNLVELPGLVRATFASDRTPPSGQLEGPDVKPVLTQNATARQAAKESIQQAISVLQEVIGPGLERDLVESYLIDELLDVIKVLDLDTARVEELLAARRTVERVLTLIEKAKDIFARYGPDIAVGALGNAAFELAKVIGTTV